MPNNGSSQSEHECSPPLSYVKGETATPLLHETIGGMFDKTCNKYPNNTALAVPFQDTRWSYEELHYQVNKLAAHLLSLGLKPGDRVGIWSPNNSEWVVTQMATAKVGLILVNINPAYRLSELSYALNMVQCKTIVTAREFKTSKYLDMLMELLSDDVHYEVHSDKFQSDTLPHLQNIICLGNEKDSLPRKVVPYCHLMEIDPLPSEQCKIAKVASTIQPTDNQPMQSTCNSPREQQVHPKLQR